mmetsp:Transcript_60776/g.112757  ORF Transcript_60776/g.112757 Transcript_60776/m.112757 type:complete len:127 (+) Transcript_60776:71-451(+)
MQQGASHLLSDKRACNLRPCAKTYVPRQREGKVWKRGSYVNPQSLPQGDTLRPQEACQGLAPPQVLYCSRALASVQASTMLASEFIGRLAKLSRVSVTVVVAVVASTTSATTSRLAMVKLGSTACN